MSFVLAIPSKGRLQEQASEYLADCGLKLSQGARNYAARIASIPEIEVRLISAGEIARAIAAGEVHVGVTGEDVLREADPDLARTVPVKPLGFGRADMVIAVPDSWLDVTRVSDLAEVAALHRARTGRRMRIATKYLAQAQAFLDARGVADYRLVESLGATEGAPAAGAAEAIVDITTTGATLAANHLRTLADGTILKSQALLAASRAARWSEGAHSAFERMLDVIEARARAKTQRLLRVAPGPEGAEPMVARAAELGCRLASPTPEGALLELYCPADKVSAVCAALQNLFGGAIGVFEADFLFERPNAAYASFRAALAKAM
ncbi:ATP phosphoribosyltransferase [alpha proteobacterium U9-1i]|nr:ATP phosphoribosyltransferase [alpha proteobacterium U9-1i]